MTAAHTRNGWAYDQAKRKYWAALERQGVYALPCWRCGKLVNLQRTGRYDNLARSIDHTIEVEKGGPLLDTSTWRVSHLGCNRNKVKPSSKSSLGTPSRDW